MNDKLKESGKTIFVIAFCVVGIWIGIAGVVNIWEGLRTMNTPGINSSEIILNGVQKLMIIAVFVMYTEIQALRNTINKLKNDDAK